MVVFCNRGLCERFLEGWPVGGRGQEDESPARGTAVASWEVGPLLFGLVCLCLKELQPLDYVSTFAFCFCPMQEEQAGGQPG